MEWECPICKTIEKRDDDEIKELVYEYQDVDNWDGQKILKGTKQSTIDVQICNHCGSLSIPISEINS